MKKHASKGRKERGRLANAACFYLSYLTFPLITNVNKKSLWLKASLKKKKYIVKRKLLKLISVGGQRTVQIFSISIYA